MTAKFEFGEYVSVSVGMALATTCYTVVAAMFGVASLQEIVVAIGVAALLCMAVAMGISKLAAAFPGAPSFGLFLSKALGRPAAQFLMYLYLSVVVMLSGVESTMLARVLVTLAPGLSPYPVVLGLLALIVAINFVGIELSRAAQLWITVALILSLLGLSGWAIAVAPPVLPAAVEAVPAVPAVPFGPGLGPAIGISVFLFLGFEWVTPAARNAQAYARLIPLAMLTSLVILGATYVTLSLALAAHFPAAAIAGMNAPHLVLAQTVWPEYGTLLGTVLSVFAAVTSFNAGVLGAARLAYSMGREGTLPSVFARMSLSTATPVGALAILGALAMVSAVLTIWAGAHLILAALGAFVECIIYAALMLSLLRLKLKLPLPFGAHLFGLVTVVLPVLGAAAIWDAARIAGVAAFLALCGAALWLNVWATRQQAAQT